MDSQLLIPVAGAGPTGMCKGFGTFSDPHFVCDSTLQLVLLLCLKMNPHNQKLSVYYVPTLLGSEKSMKMHKWLIIVKGQRVSARGSRNSLDFEELSTDLGESVEI